jgi:hypothetical protein
MRIKKLKSVKKNPQSASGALMLFLSGLLITACTSTQFNTELGVNHPADPAAKAAVFIPPPNPFATEDAEAQPIRPSAGAGSHQGHAESVGPGRKMETMKPQVAAPAGGAGQSTEHRH